MIHLIIVLFGWNVLLTIAIVKFYKSAYETLKDHKEVIENIWEAVKQ